MEQGNQPKGFRVPKFVWLFVAFSPAAFILGFVTPLAGIFSLVVNPLIAVCACYQMVDKTKGNRIGWVGFALVLGLALAAVNLFIAVFIACTAGLPNR
jgi:hypothetical protein